MSSPLDEGRLRIATVTNVDSLEQLRRYMPGNYKALHFAGRYIIVGVDTAGWTMDDYVIPRLASGLLWAKEWSINE